MSDAVSPTPDPATPIPSNGPAAARARAVTGAVATGGAPLAPGDAVTGPLSLAAEGEATLVTASGATLVVRGPGQLAPGGATLAVTQGTLLVTVPDAAPLVLDTASGRLVVAGAAVIAVHPGRGVEALLLPDEDGATGSLTLTTRGGALALDRPLRLVTAPEIDLPPWSTVLACDDPLLAFARDHGWLAEGCAGAAVGDETRDSHGQAGELETSPGGGMEALTSDRLTVTAAPDAFDLRPETVDLAEPGELDPATFSPTWAASRSHRYLASLRFPESAPPAAPPPPSRILPFEDFETDIGTWQRLMPRLGEPDALYLRVEAYDEPRPDHLGELPPLYPGQARLHPFDPARAVARALPRDGGTMALIATGPLDAIAADYTAANPASDLEGFLGLPLGALPADRDGSPAGDGAALRASVQLNAGDVLRFNFLFDAADELPDSDFAVFTVSDGRTRALYPLATLRDWSVGDYGSTGWWTGRFTAPTSGTFTIGFAVVNDGPGTADSGDSRLLLDNVRVLRGAGAVGGEPFVATPVPTAVPDVAATDDDVAVRLPLFANDVNLDTASTAEIAAINGVAVAPGGQVALPSGAVVRVGVGGAVVYDPNGAFAGLAAEASANDGFTYTLADALGNRDTAAVSVTVTNANTAPTAIADVFTVAADQRLPFGPSLLANDRDLDRDPLTVIAVEQRFAIGHVLVLPDGRFAYDPDGQFAVLAAGETALDGFRYAITDGRAESAWAPVRVTVVGVNDAPVARNDGAVTDEDTPTRLAVTANDDDIDSDDGADTLRLIAARALSGTPVAIAADGRSLLFDPTGVFNALSRRDVGADTLVYTISDRHGATATAAVGVSILGVNDAPIARADRLDVDEDQRVALPTAVLLANDADPDNGDQLAIVAVDNGTVHGGVSVAAGQVTFDPGRRYDWLAQGETITEGFRYTVSDGWATAQAPVTLVVHGINDPVQAVADHLSVGEDGASEIAAAQGLLANDVDPDLSDQVRVIAATVGGVAVPVGNATLLPSGALITVRASGAVVFDARGAYDHLAVGTTASETLSYVVTDGHVTDTTTARLTIVGANDRPVAGDDHATVLADRPARLDLLANDTDVDEGDRLVIGGVDRQSVPGWLNVNADGTLTYDPEDAFRALGAGERATLRFAYEVSDGHAGGQAAGQVTITVVGVNDAPTAGGDQLLVDAGQTLALDAGLGLLANDTDPDAHDRLRVTAVNGDAALVGQSITLASGATLVVAADGGVRLTPGAGARALAAGELSTDGLTYTIGDGEAFDTATLQLVTRGVNDAPEANADAADAVEDGPFVAIDVLANDRDPDRGEGARLRVVGAVAASGATVIVGADGTLLYDPGTISSRRALAEGARWEHADTITYVVRDPSGADGTATVAVALIGRNDAPEARADHAHALANGAPVIIDALANDGDADGDESAASLRIVAAQAASGAEVVVGGAGQPLVYRPATTSAFAHLGQGEQATDTLHYWLVDSHGARAAEPGVITVTVTGVNDPVVAVDDLLRVGAGGPEQAATNLLANDQDTDARDRPHVTAIDGIATAVGRWASLASGARVLVSAEGGVTYDPAGRFDALAAGETALDAFAYTVSDGASSATAVARVILTGVNDAPVAVADAARAVAGGEAVRVDVLANDSDPDHDAALPGGLRLVAAVAESGATVVLGGTPAGGAAGTLLYNPASTSRFAALAAGETGHDRIRYRIEDGHGLGAEGVVEVTVVGVNDAPVAGDDSLNTRADQVLSLSGALGLLANDADPDRGDGPRVAAVNGQATAVGQTIRLARGGLLTVMADGALLYDPTGSAELRALPEFARAEEHFTYTLSDGAGATSTARVTIGVLGHNEPPGASPDWVSTEAGLPLRLWPLANDTDPDAVASVRLVDVPETSAAGARLHAGSDGSLTYDPRGAFPGLVAGQTAIDHFDYVIDDLTGQRSRATVTITVHGGGVPAGAGETLLQSFEDPGLPMRAWGFLGQVDVAGGANLHLPTHQGALALITAAGATRGALARDLELVGDDGRPLPGAAWPVDPWDGSGLLGVGGGALKATLALSAADWVEGRLSLAFDWSFVNAAGGGENGLAFVSVSDGTTARLYSLADGRTTGIGASGWRTATLALDSLFALSPAPLLLTVGLGVVNDQTDAAPARLVLDNVRLNRQVGADHEPLALSADGVLAVSRERPLAGEDAALATDENGAVARPLSELLANDRASTGASPASLAITAAHASQGRATLVGDRLLFDPEGAFDDLAEGESRLARVTYTLTDANHGTAGSGFDVRVHGRNDTPVAAPDTLAAVADRPLALTLADLLANDHDPDASDTLVFRALDNAGTLGVLEARDGRLTYDPAGRFAALGEGAVAHDRFRYVVGDGRAETTGAVTVVVTGRNDAITAGDDALAAQEDRPLPLTAAALFANDADPDVGDEPRLLALNGVAVAGDGTVRLPSGALLTLANGALVAYDANGAFAFLAAGESRDDRFTYTVGDGHGSSATATVTVTVTGANQPPGAEDDFAITDQDAAVRIAVLANDTDPDTGDRLRLVGLDTTGTIGGARINADGTLTYDVGGQFDYLRPGETAFDSLRYTVADAAGATSTATAVIRVTGVERPQDQPQELLQSFETRPLPNPVWGFLGQARVLDQLTANGPSGPLPYFPTHREALALVTAAGTTRGALARDLGLVGLDGRGVPGAAWPSDPVDGSGLAGVGGGALKASLALSPLDWVEGGLSLSFDWSFVNAADAAAGENALAFVSVSDGTTARLYALTDGRATGVGASGWRTATLALDSLFPLSPAPRLLTLGLGVVNDQTDAAPAQLLLDNVRLNRTLGADHEPLALSADGALAISRERPLAGEDLDPTGRATLADTPLAIALAPLLVNDQPSRGVGRDSLRLVGLEGSRAGASVTLAGEGQLLYDPRGRFHALAQGETTTDLFRYALGDGNGGADFASVAVTVTGLNDAPVALPDFGRISEDAALALAVLANDDDVDSDDDETTLRLVEAHSSLGAGVSVTGAPGQGLLYRAEGAAIQALAEGERVVDRVAYTLADRHGATAAGVALVTVTGVNDAPVARADGASIDEDGAVTLAVTANDDDVDGDDGPSTLQVIAARSTSGVPVAITAEGGRLVYQALGHFDRLRAGETTFDTVTYTLADRHGATATGTATLAIAGRNDAPIAGADSFATGETTALAVAVAGLLANDLDPEPGDAPRFLGLDVGGTQGRVAFDGATLVYDPTGRFQALAAGESTLDRLGYLIADPHGATAMGVVQIRVTGVNDAPVAQADAATTDEDTALRLDVTLNDHDPDHGDRLTVIGLDTTGTLGRVGLAADGAIVYDPRGAFDGLRVGDVAHDHFTYTVADRWGALSSARATVSVTGLSDVEKLIDSFERPIAEIERTGADVTLATAYQETDGGRGLWRPTDGGQLLRLDARGTPAQPVGADPVPPLERFLGLPAHRLPNDVDGTYPASGSAARLYLSAHREDRLSFDWLFDARDATRAPADGHADNDFAVVSIVDVATGQAELFTLADTRGTGDKGATGWRAARYTLDHDADLMIGFAVVNDRASGPASDNSTLLVDNVRLNRAFDDGYQVIDSQHHGRFETLAHHG